MLCRPRPLLVHPVLNHRDIAHTAGAYSQSMHIIDNSLCYLLVSQTASPLLLPERDAASQTANVKFPYDQGMALTVQLLASHLPLPMPQMYGASMYGMSKITSYKPHNAPVYQSRH